MIYRDLIIDLYKNPMNLRAMPNAEAVASGANPLCGDRVRMYAKHNRQGGTISDCSFEGEGCAISMAAASLVTEEAKGKTTEEISQWNLENVQEWLGTELTASRVKCGLLALETLQQAFTKYRQHNDVQT